MDKSLIINDIKNHLSFKTDKEFAEFLGIKQNTLSTWRSRNMIDYDLIISKCDFIDANWLLTGKGDMLLQNNDIHCLQSVRKEKIEETRPRIPMDAAAGSLTAAADGITIDDCEQLPVIKAFARYDFTIFARGDSMFPEYHSGDELACLYVKNTTFIQWGCCHVLDTVQGIVVKRIYDDGEYILCKSENSELFKDFRIHKTEVYNIALVIGLVRRY